VKWWNKYAAFIYLFYIYLFFDGHLAVTDFHLRNKAKCQLDIISLTVWNAFDKILHLPVLSK